MKMQNNREIKREPNSAYRIHSVSSQMNGAAPSSGGAVDWKKRSKEEFDKRTAIEEKHDNLQAEVFLYGPKLDSQYLILW